MRKDINKAYVIKEKEEKIEDINKESKEDLKEIEPRSELLYNPFN